MKGAYKFLIFLTIPAILLAGIFAFYQTALAADQCQAGDKMCVSGGIYKLPKFTPEVQLLLRCFLLKKYLAQPLKTNYFFS